MKMPKVAGRVPRRRNAAEQARALTEEALELYDQGRTDEADELVEKALALDRETVEEVVREMDEDAATRED